MARGLWTFPGPPQLYKANTTMRLKTTIFANFACSLHSTNNYGLSTAPHPHRMIKDERCGLFARLAWLTCYSAVFAAEWCADAELLTELAARFAS